MRKVSYVVVASLFIMSCNQPKPQEEAVEETAAKEEIQENFQWETEQFADIRILRYQIPGWDNLSLKQKQYVYYLTQAGLSGRDILWDQFYRHNIEIRTALETLVKNYEGDRDAEDWKSFMVYMKRVWFSNGIHHHYSHQKIKPEFTSDFLRKALLATHVEMSKEAFEVIFNNKDAKKVSKDSSKDLLLASAVNFYDPDITEKEATDFYKKLKVEGDSTPISYGLNSKLIRNKAGKIEEVRWAENAMYGKAITEIIGWLEKAKGVAENDAQAHALGLLIEYYRTGDLKTWDAYNIAWVNATEGDIDYINSFIEVYDDPLGYKATYETIVQINDFDASQKMSVISDNIQYFEDNSPIMNSHKKPNVTGVTYKMVNVAGEAGATTPSTPIGVNLPNANWIRTVHGSKSVSLANIESAYEHAKGAGFLEEFTFTTAELERAKKYSTISGKMHTALHEVVGHASGKLNEGVGTPKETLKNYASTLEEGRADLVALYYIMDPKLMELGLIDTIDVAYAEYDGYIRNGLMLQLRRLAVGDEIEEDHMRNRQLVAAWAYEMGKKDNVIEKKSLDGKTYFVINDYDKLRTIFGEQLREIQRIKSEGDYDAGKLLVETYGVKVDPEIHKEVLDRTAKLNIAPYNGFIQPVLRPLMEGDSLVDIEVLYPKDFTQQMLMYGEEYHFLR